METTFPPRVEPQAFKATMAQWATGVTIVTTLRGGTPVGMTVSSFASVTLEPPQILVSLNQRANTHGAVAESGYFAVNLLSAEQQEWGKRFAGFDPAVHDRFAGIDWTTAVTGAPILPGGLAWLDCQVSQRLTVGDHTFFIGAVVACDAGDEKQPLLYYHRNWRRLAG